MCIGNHDVVDEHECKGEYAQARAEYYELTKSFANSMCRAQSIDAKAVLCELPDGVWALSMDSTIGGTPREPGCLSDEEIDTIAGWVYDLPKSDLLIVATHYPAVISQDSVADYIEKDPNYHRRHEWREGKPLRERIRGIRRREHAPTLWLSGDIHQPEHICVEREHFFVTTGRLGTATPSSDSAIPRQAKLIEIDRVTKEAVVFTASFHARGYAENAHVGDWKTEKSPMRTPAEVLSASVSGVVDESITTSTVPLRAPVPAVPREIEVLDDGSLASRILDIIAEKKLYTIGRFHTSDELASLAWVSIGPLLNEPGILPSVINRMALWLEKRFAQDGLKPGEGVLIGVDCWGAVLASQLSVITGSPNFCIAARGRGAHSTPHETISDRVCQRIEQVKLVVLVADVVGTGSTMKWVHDEVTKKVNGPLVWCALSIVADRLQSRPLEFLNAFAVACGDLRMPVLAKDAVPDERILPARLSFAIG
jgi:hypoxanthine-guanine phosphoribosyltransferase